MLQKPQDPAGFQCAGPVKPSPAHTEGGTDFVRGHLFFAGVGL